MRTTSIIIGVLALTVGLVLLWFFFFRAPVSQGPTDQGTGLQTGGMQSVGVSGTSEPVGNQTTPLTNSVQPIFKIGDGPIAGATVIQTLRPTTTLARYVQQNNGHIFDLSLDSAGAIPKPVSNTTIPGIVRALWAEGGSAVILQYLDSGTVKSVHLGFPTGSSTTTKPVSIKFLPDGIRDIAVSPNGASVVYLLRTASGVAGYTAKADGTGSRQLFSLPLSEILLSWPAPNTLIAQSKSGLGISGISFSISAQSGRVMPLLYAPSLTLTANPTFSHIVYQTAEDSSLSTYAREVASGKSAFISFDPYPEKCIWSTATTTLMYCAAPLEYVEPTYLTEWHQGGAVPSDVLLAFDVARGSSDILTAPGGEEGGVESAIESMFLSADNKYLLFIRRGDYSLWGVRL